MCENRSYYIIDFTNIDNIGEFHDAIQKGLDFPDYYGKNWSALWDCLTDMSGEISIEIHGFDTVKGKFPEAAEMLTEILSEWRHYDEDKYIDQTHVTFADENGNITMLF